MTQILLLGGISKLYHNITKVGPIFKSFLTKAEYGVTISEDMDQLLPMNIKNYQIVIDYTTQQVITKSQENSLLIAIRENSILYIGIHGATTSYKDSEGILKMIGARFVRHPPLRKIFVTLEDSNHPILNGISDFTIRDELYIQEYFLPFQTVFSTKYKGRNIPLSWIKTYGDGTVFYLALGHDCNQLKNPNIERIINNVIVYWLGK